MAVTRAWRADELSQSGRHVGQIAIYPALVPAMSPRLAGRPNCRFLLP